MIKTHTIAVVAVWASAFFLFSQEGQSAIKKNGPRCESYKSEFLNRNVRYCIQRSRPNFHRISKEPVVYFFHGINGGAKSWTDNGYAEALDQMAEPESFPPITFVSFDTSALSMFSDYGGQQQGENAYETWFITEFIPMIEAKLDLCRSRNCRFTAGVSMGGYGALKMALRHSDLFSAAAANSPSLFPFSLWEPNGAWISYFSRHEVGSVRGMALLFEVRNIFQNTASADQNDPDWLARSFWNTSQFPLLYFDVGGKDYFGFDEGFFRFKSSLEKKGVHFESTFVPDGTHELFWQRRYDLLRFFKFRILNANRRAF
ncbi:MAG: alpha/beta hydrolase-fold protein [Bdellovibrionota bacterium]